MSKTIIKLTGSALAFAALVQPASAQVQACLPQDDLADGIIYFMPAIVQAVSERCAGHLSYEGYLAMQGGAFADRYLELQDESWPGALRMLSQFSSGEADGMSELLDQFPAEALRPFVDAVVVLRVNEEIKPEHCRKIERAMELLAPLPPENTAELIAFLAAIAGNKLPAICAEDSQ